ncbi:hth domain-containing protein [Halococcus thailandensis JCM 13552]|uniref:Hth domain-containing protein n=2 Tax=Halococcus thailandensis TaxID=335952 RepID=M0NF94_9EURY|nr:hth domain-containing protein [Halococcus thailandensis JCM 13552]
MIPVTEERDDEGQYSSSWSEADFLEALREFDGVAGTRDVAERVGCSRKTAYRWLTDLAEKNEIDQRTAGRELIWLLAEDG